MPRSRAICPAAWPIVVPPPWISIVLPGSVPSSDRCRQAVSTAIGSAAARTKSRPSGTTVHRSMIACCDAPALDVPRQSAVPGTTSPARTSVTPSPTASTVPDTSIPTPRGRSSLCRPRHSARSAGARPHAWTATRIRPGLGRGIGTVSRRSTSSGSPTVWTRRARRDRAHRDARRAAGRGHRRPRRRARRGRSALRRRRRRPRGRPARHRHRHRGAGRTDRAAAGPPGGRTAPARPGGMSGREG